jgi:hypothetical protein
VHVRKDCTPLRLAYIFLVNSSTASDLRKSKSGGGAGAISLLSAGDIRTVRIGFKYVPDNLTY